jgi:hypothetical protein
MPAKSLLMSHCRWRVALAAAACLGVAGLLVTVEAAQAQSNPQLDLRPRIVPPGQKPPRTGSEFGTDWANPRNVWRAPPGYRDPSGIETDQGCIDVGPGMPTPRGRKRCR